MGECGSSFRLRLSARHMTSGSDGRILAERYTPDACTRARPPTLLAVFPAPSKYRPDELNVQHGGKSLDDEYITRIYDRAYAQRVASADALRSCSQA